MDKFNEEKQYLDKVLEVLDTEIKAANNKEEELKKTYKTLSFEDIKRGDGLNLNSLLDFYGRRAYTLGKAISNPYFGRIDVKLEDEDQVSKIYIGKSNLDSEGKTYITDWRAPICSIYYDSEVGKTSYKSHSETYEADLLLKRQLIIEDSKLLDVLDTNLVTNDELLKPFLSVNADDKMKIIVSSIQKEQNSIIRLSPNKNIIVQGVAGSGKTSVALHRISYLVYDRLSKMKSDEFLILGPNKYFLKYISGILPELETDPVEQNTFTQMANSYLQSNVKEIFADINKLPESERKLFSRIQSFKSSLEYKRMVKTYIEDYISTGIYQGDFTIDGNIVFRKEDVVNVLFSGINKVPQIERAEGYFIAKFKTNFDDIYKAMNKKYRDVYVSLPIGDPVRNAAVEKSNQLRDLLKNKGQKLIKDYFKKMKDKPFDLYQDFINNIEKYNTILTSEEIEYLRKTSNGYLQKNCAMFEDFAAVMHIKHLISGEEYQYKHIVIDEAQDYGLYHFSVLKDIAPHSYFSIYGDLAQSIYSYRGLKSWDEVISGILDNNCEQLYLNKSYRTTIEITKAANCILDRLNMPEATPVVRHGSVVSCVNSGINNTSFIELINGWLKNGYKSIAIVCRDEAEATATYNYLKKNNVEANYLNNNKDTYYGGISILTSADSKGLEFDAVAISDASNNKFKTDSDYDMHLLYVACTRALHELKIFHKGKLCEVFENNPYIDFSNEDMSRRRSR